MTLSIRPQEAPHRVQNTLALRSRERATERFKAAHALAINVIRTTDAPLTLTLTPSEGEREIEGCGVCNHCDSTV
jgi:hypothetical protein